MVRAHDPDWEVCAEASTGGAAVRLATEHSPDVAVIDISMPGLNGLDATRQILKERPGVRVVILSVHYSEQLVREVFDTGAFGYALKTDASRDLLVAIEAVAAGRHFVTPGLSDVLVGYLKSPAEDRGEGVSTQGVTSREREVIQLLAEGKSNKEIAGSLKLSVKTVETHRARIMSKLDLASLPDLVRYAIRNHIIDA